MTDVRVAVTGRGLSHPGITVVTLSKLGVGLTWQILNLVYEFGRSNIIIRLWMKGSKQSLSVVHCINMTGAKITRETASTSWLAAF